MTEFIKGIVLALIFFSCGKDTVDYGLGKYRVDLGTVQMAGTTISFLLDDGKTIFPESGDLSNLKDKQRVLINYSFLEESKPGYDYLVRINGISQISQGDLSAVSPLTIASAANDPIQLESAWIGSHYLNIQFRIEYKSQPHAIFLFADSSKKTGNPVRIYFRHDKNHDAPGALQKIVASYDLKPVLGDPLQNKVLSINFNTTNYGDTTFLLKY